MNCGEDSQLVNETNPVCIPCFGLVLYTGEQFEPDKPPVSVTITAGKKKPKKQTRKQIVEQFMKDQRWSKAMLLNIIKKL
ncbi:MAG: hypothetical protein ABIP54_02470 [Candidatus Andersenbacteria bacterium]